MKPRRAALFVLACICAFLVTELVVRYGLGYPVYGLDKKVKIRDIGWSNIWKPYSKYWNVEGGNRTYSRNNLGLPGIDVLLNKDTRNVLVLGSSYVEANQIPKARIASSILQQKLQKLDPCYQVINLGYSGNNILDSFLRLRYFQAYVHPEKVILVIDPYNLNCNASEIRNALKLHDSNRFGKQKAGRKHEMLVAIRNTSATANLIVNGLKNIHEGDLSGMPQTDKKESSVFRENKAALEFALGRSIAINRKQSKFELYCLSIHKDQKINEWLERICARFDIPFVHRQVLKKENLINGLGHMNQEGNEVLADAIFELLREGSR